MPRTNSGEHTPAAHPRPAATRGSGAERTGRWRARSGRPRAGARTGVRRSRSAAVTTEARRSYSGAAPGRPWQSLYFLPEPQGHGALRPGSLELVAVAAPCRAVAPPPDRGLGAAVLARAAVGQRPAAAVGPPSPLPRSAAGPASVAVAAPRRAAAACCCEGSASTGRTRRRGAAPEPPRRRGGAVAGRATAVRAAVAQRRGGRRRGGDDRRAGCRGLAARRPARPAPAGCTGSRPTPP